MEEVWEKIKRLDGSSRLECVYNASRKKKMMFVLSLLIILTLSALISLGIGSVNISISDTLRSVGNILFPSIVEPPADSYYVDFIYARGARISMCILCGASLAISGAVMQGILRNPLVSPFTLGVSSAASFGAAVAIVMSSSFVTITSATGFFGQDLLIVAMAFVCGLSSILLVLMISRKGDVSRSTIILAGVIISYLFQAGVSLAKYVSNDDSLREITLWLLGGMWDATWSSVRLILPAVLLISIYLESLAKDINTISAGDDTAVSLGINVKKLRRNGLIASTFVTSICIAFTGIIGFIGLMAPHLCRMFIGNDYRYLIPASALAGAVILTISDTVARVIIAPQDLPVGIIMYILGGLFFIWISLRGKEARM